MSDSLSDLYNEFLNLEASITGPQFPTMGVVPVRGPISSEDGETFVTSKEIVKQKELEEKLSEPRGKGGIHKEIEETAHFRRYTTQRQHKYTETEMRDIRESCMATIVHDYGEHDIYHLTDEERAAKDELNEMRDDLQKLKRIYSKPEEYVEAMRVVMRAWEMLERNSNFFYSKKEFFNRVADGRIYSNSIIRPKLKRLNMYDMDTLIQLISNPDADASRIARMDEKEYDEEWYIQQSPEYQEHISYFMDHYEELWLDKLTKEEEEELIKEYGEDYRNNIPPLRLELESEKYASFEMDQEAVYRLLSPNEVQLLHDHAEQAPAFQIGEIPYKDIKGYDERRFGRRKKTKGGKYKRYKRKHLHELLNRIQLNYGKKSRRRPDYYDISTLVTHSIFEPEEEFEDFWDKIYYDASWTDKEALFRYDLAVREELLKQHPPGQVYLTYADKQLEDFFATLESAGLNVVELRTRMNIRHDPNTVINEGTKKDNKKKEAAILDRVIKMNRSSKFKKLVAKAEKGIIQTLEDGDDEDE